jgi:cyclin-dependent kinase 12/13
LADFGLSRKFRDERNMTFKVVTLWYRSPELMLQYRKYDYKVDIWSLGCVFAEFFIKEVLFKSTNFNRVE